MLWHGGKALERPQLGHLHHLHQYHHVHLAQGLQDEALHLQLHQEQELHGQRLEELRQRL